jgi:ABC-type uncharacterized transport system permease subunit
MFIAVVVISHLVLLACAGVFYYRDMLLKEAKEHTKTHEQLRRLERDNSDSHRLMLDARRELLKSHAELARLQLRDKFLSESMCHKVEQFKIMLKSPVTSDAEKNQLIEAALAAKQLQITPDGKTVHIANTQETTTC